MIMFVDVAFPISSYKVFTYKAPPTLVKKIAVGIRVNAPFGRRSAKGIVVAVHKSNPYKGKVREIESYVDDKPVLDKPLWELIIWMSDYYLTPIGQVAKTVLPSKLSTRYDPPALWMVRILSKGDNANFGKLSKNAPTQAKVLDQLKNYKDFIQVSELRSFASSPLKVCQGLEEKGLVKLFKETKKPNITAFTFDPIPKQIYFTKKQQEVLHDLSLMLNPKKFSSHLLHGVTGSGKTEIYIEISRKVLACDRTVIILLPEILITPQIAGRFRAVFGDTVALWHSKLTQAVRAWTWKRICLGDFKVIIGARSAIFAPVKNLGLIVVDEEQESSYKQEYPAPKYHTREVALMRGKLHKAMVIMASATPSLESYYNQIKGKFTYLQLSHRYGGAKYPQVYVVDMKKDQEEAGKFGQVFSGLLLDKIEDRLNKSEQIILLQNRRGYSPIFRCNDCGEVEMCPRCNVTLTYHKVGNSLQCHFCGLKKKVVKLQCKHCSGHNLGLLGIGTQKVEDILIESFPGARLARLDFDTARSISSITNLLKKFSLGKIDILLGTQMIAKGLDFENITLVGIINADTGLHLPDFRAGERVFQLIYQASGRSGRHKKPGEVVIQTYDAENTVIKQATKLNLKKYYNMALSERRELNYPPFSWMANLVFSGKKKITVLRKADKVRSGLSGKYKGLDIIGPAPCYRERLRGKYRIQIVFKSAKSQDQNGLKLHHFLQQNFGLEINQQTHSGVIASLDINPVSIQ